LNYVPNDSKIVYIDISGNELLSADLKSVLGMIVALEEKSEWVDCGFAE
jgi:hypothetical protein